MGREDYGGLLHVKFLCSMTLNSDSGESESIAMKRGTKTQEDQWMVQRRIFQIYYDLFGEIFLNPQFDMDSAPPGLQQSEYLKQLCCNLRVAEANVEKDDLELKSKKHVEYLTKGLKCSSFTVFDSSQPWLCYWILHSIALLGVSVDARLKNHCIDFLGRCQDQKGGFGGGPGQMPHLLTTYAAVNSLITLGGWRSLSSIDRGKLYDFLLQMKDKSGGFRMHDGGEVDVRGCYAAISTASVLNVLDDDLIQNVGDYILSCQTYEGGIANEPGSEAHGGYAFCGLATMILINEVNRLDVPALINWVVFRQGIEYGFQGRTNKLVDGCYSFWQGGVAALIQQLHLIVSERMWHPNILECECSTYSKYDSTKSDIYGGEQCFQGTNSHVNDICQLKKEGKRNTYNTRHVNNVGYDFIRRRVDGTPLINNEALRLYILLCSQGEGGFRDKPGKPSDLYHTCYCLSGLSVIQYSSAENFDSSPWAEDILWPYSDLLERVHPLYNIVLDRYYEACEFFTRS